MEFLTCGGGMAEGPLTFIWCNAYLKHMWTKEEEFNGNVQSGHLGCVMLNDRILEVNQHSKDSH